MLMRAITTSEISNKEPWRHDKLTTNPPKHSHITGFIQTHILCQALKIQVCIQPQDNSQYLLLPAVTDMTIKQRACKPSANSSI